MFSIDDPLMQIVLSALIQQQGSQQQGITPAAQQGAMPISSGPMGTIGMQNPLTVQPQSQAWQNASPLERSLSQAATARSYYQPDEERLAFENNTINFLEGINQQNTGVYDRRMQAQALAQKEALDREVSLQEKIVPKQIDLEIEKMKIAAAQGEDIDKAYLDGFSKIATSSDSTTEDKGKALAAFKKEYTDLKRGKSGAINPEKALAAEIDKLRQRGVPDEQIKQGIIADTEANPQFADAGKKAIEYINMTTMLPTRHSRSAPVRPQPQQVKQLEPKQAQGPVSLSANAKKLSNTVTETAKPLGQEVMNAEDMQYLLQEFVETMRKAKGWNDAQVQQVWKFLKGTLGQEVTL